MTSRTEATVRNELGREYACIENIDDQVGLVIQKLKRSVNLRIPIFFTLQIMALQLEGMA